MVDCFKGQPPRRRRPSATASILGNRSQRRRGSVCRERVQKRRLKLTDIALLENITRSASTELAPVIRTGENQGQQGSISISRWKPALARRIATIKTIFELNKQYGWSKFIIVVPSIAIREGGQVAGDHGEHFLETYHKKARCSSTTQAGAPSGEFSSDAGINVMVINPQRLLLALTTGAFMTCWTTSSLADRLM